MDEHIAMYMEELDAYDAEVGKKISRQEKEHKLEVCRERKALYMGYQDQLEESGEAQLSLTVPDAQLMKQNEGFCVGYNVQTAVDAESHLIAGYSLTDSPTDHGLLADTASEVKADFGVDILASTADKECEAPDDHAEVLASGIVPNVIQRNGEGTEEVRFEYHEAVISEEQQNSARPEDLKAGLEAGVVPIAYKFILSEG